MQCGVAALAMVCRYHGLPCTVQELEGICRPTREGVSLKGIADAARELGLETRGLFWAGIGAILFGAVILI